jgi:hypothetical protein
MLPGQQADPVAPQLMQVRGIPIPGFAQARPPLQLLPVQQTSPLPPHGSQVIAPPPAVGAWHEKPASQASAPAPLQQSAPDVPQLMHICVVVSQRVLGAVQAAPPAPPVQQTSLSPPQLVPPVPPVGVQEPPEQVPSPPPQVVPELTQFPRRQQPPVSHTLAAQHASPEPPQLGAGAPAAPVAPVVPALPVAPAAP